MSSNFQRTFAHLVAANDVLNNPPPLQHAPGLPPQLPPPLHPAPASPPAASTPPVRLLLRCPSSTQLMLQHPQLMDPFGLSLPLVENRNLSTKVEGHSYSYHKQRTSGYILWRCDANNKAARKKGISCCTCKLYMGVKSCRGKKS